MKPRSIILKAHEVRGVLDGSKTQIRRVVKPQPEARCTEAFQGMDGIWRFAAPTAMGQISYADWDVRCPYGHPGDVLYARETWREYRCLDADANVIEYAADNPEPVYLYDGDDFQVYNKDWSERLMPWRPSIHMPKEAARIWLHIDDVRVERLQDISEEDAIAEGVEPLDSEAHHESDRVSKFDPSLCKNCGGQRLYTAFGPNMGAFPDTDCGRCDTASKRFRWLWESINGADSWSANPWVWVIKFSRIEKPKEA